MGTNLHAVTNVQNIHVQLCSSHAESEQDDVPCTYWHVVHVHLNGIMILKQQYADQVCTEVLVNACQHVYYTFVHMHMHV